MEAEQVLQRIRMQELEGDLQMKNHAYATLEKEYKGLQDDHGAINTLLQLSQSQLETSLQTNKVWEARASLAGPSYSRCASKEQELD